MINTVYKMLESHGSNGKKGKQCKWEPGFCGLEGH